MAKFIDSCGQLKHESSCFSFTGISDFLVLPGNAGHYRKDWCNFLRSNQQVATGWEYERSGEMCTSSPRALNIFATLIPIAAIESRLDRCCTFDRLEFRTSKQRPNLFPSIIQFECANLIADHCFNLNEELGIPWVIVSFLSPHTRKQNDSKI